MWNPRAVLRSAFLVLAFGVAARAALASPLPRETYWVVRIAGHEVGYVHEVSDVEPAGGAFATDTQTRLVINRLGNRVAISADAHARESHEGRLEEGRYEMSMSEQTTSLRATVRDGAVHVESTVGDQHYSRDIEVASAPLGAEGIRALARDRLRQAGDQASFLMFMPELGAVVSVTRTVEPDAAGLHVKEEIAGLPVSTLWLDAEGLLIRQEQPGPFGVQQTQRCDAATALRAVSGDALPEELFDRTLVRANARPAQARAIEAAVLRITRHDAALDWPPFEGPGQHVMRQTPTETVLQVTRSAAPATAIARPVPVTDANREYLDPNATLNSDDPEIGRIAAEIVGTQHDACLAALALRDWVSSHMSLDLGIALAPASEVVRNRRGTCIAYTALLTSLCRAAGIPARCAMGLVYVNGAWGGHAWTQVQLGQAWVAIDAAIPGPGPADAARIAGSTSSLRDGTGELLAAGQALYGSVDIDFASYTIAGRTIDVPADAPLYTVAGDRYENAWAQVALTKPHDFTFEKLDAVWPEPALVTLAGPSGRTVRLLQRLLPPGIDVAQSVQEELADLVTGGDSATLSVAGRSASAKIAREAAAVAIPSGLDLWVLVAQGSDAPALLQTVASTLTLSDPAGAAK